jgi:ABC-type multidrug transport system fused ATPase/permease subunit
VERAAFARARRFLNYYPGARYSALVAAVATGIVYVCLLITLAFFADLMVNRGDIPCFANLLPRDRTLFEESIELPEDQAERNARLQTIRQEFKDLGLDTARSLSLASTTTPDKLPPRDQLLRMELLWYADLVPFLRDAVGDDAADLFRDHLRAALKTYGVETVVKRDQEDFGALSLVVRTRNTTLQGSLVQSVVSWNPWMWAYGDGAYLRGLLLVGVGLAVLRAALMFTNNYMAARATIEATQRLRRAIYHHTYRLGTLAFRALGPSEAVSVSTRHLEAVHDGLYSWLTTVFREPVKFGLVLLFALLVNFWLALAFLMFALLVWLVGGQIAAYFRRQGRAANQRAADQLALIQESLMLMRLVKVYLMELFNQSRVERQLARYAAAQLRRYRGEAIYRPVFLLLGMLAALALLYVVGLVVLGGQVGVTTVIVLATALVSLYWPLEAWLENRRYLRRARESAGVLFRFLDRPGGVGQVVEAEFLPALSRSLEFDNVTLQEPGTGRKLLQGVTFTAPAGRRVALVGPEDTEKHAIVYLIPRFLDPTSGEIRIDRHNLRWVTLDSLRAQIAIVLQHNLVFNDTVANNIGCGDPSFTLPKIIEAAKVAHAHQFIQKLPRGYETPIGDLGHPLRISEQFRVALARAILRDPALLIIEEPQTPMDDDTKALLDDTFARVLPGRTVIFLPHRLSTIRNCDRVYLVYNGRIEAAGEHRELLAQNELYRHLQYLEFNEFTGVGLQAAAKAE